MIMITPASRTAPPKPRSVSARAAEQRAYVGALEASVIGAAKDAAVTELNVERTGAGGSIIGIGILVPVSIHDARHPTPIVMRANRIRIVLRIGRAIVLRCKPGFEAA